MRYSQYLDRYVYTILKLAHLRQINSTRYFSNSRTLA